MQPENNQMTTTIDVPTPAMVNAVLASLRLHDEPSRVLDEQLRGGGHGLVAGILATRFVERTGDWRVLFATIIARAHDFGRATLDERKGYSDGPSISRWAARSKARSLLKSLFADRIDVRDDDLRTTIFQACEDLAGDWADDAELAILAAIAFGACFAATNHLYEVHGKVDERTQRGMTIAVEEAARAYLNVCVQIERTTGRQLVDTALDELRALVAGLPEESRAA